MCTCPNARPSMVRAKSACVIRPATSSPFLKCLPPHKTARSLEDRATNHPIWKAKQVFCIDKCRGRGERARAAHERLRSRQSTEEQGNRGRHGAYTELES